jgi:two-component system chemotaxis response regulator CheB
VRVLVVDDSAFMRKIIAEMIDREPGFKVVGTARDGDEGVRKAQELKPDLITLDIEMPRKDGLTALREIKVLCRAFAPTVLMCSSLTLNGSKETFKALRIGAADFIPKDPTAVGCRDEAFRTELIAKLKALSSVRRERTSDRLFRAMPNASIAPTGKIELERIRAVVIGASTGGPPVLEEIFSGISQGLNVPIIVAQHMPELFTRSLASRLDQQCPCNASMPDNGSLITEPGIYIARGGAHLVPVRIAAGKVVTRIIDQIENATYTPSVDELFSAASKVWYRGLLGIQLTGMGADGARGAQDINAHGGQVIAQSADTCVVNGMPQAVIDAGAADCAMSPAEIKALLQRLSSIGKARKSA